MKENEPKDILETYPILPLRNTILFPNQIIPIYIGRQQSLNLINDISNLEKNMLLLLLRKMEQLKIQQKKTFMNTEL